MLIGTDELVATTLDSTASECISYEQGHFPTEQYNLENEEVNIATPVESTTPCVGSCPKDALYSKKIQSEIVHCPFILYSVSHFDVNSWLDSSCVIWAKMLQT